MHFLRQEGGVEPSGQALRPGDVPDTAPTVWYESTSFTPSAVRAGRTVYVVVSAGAVAAPARSRRLAAGRRGVGHFSTNGDPKQSSASARGRDRAGPEQSCLLSYSITSPPPLRGKGVPRRPYKIHQPLDTHPPINQRFKLFHPTPDQTQHLMLRRDQSI